MRVLFVIYDLSYADHVALAYLSAIAKQLGHSTFLCVLSRDALAERVRETHPDVVAYSANIVGFRQIAAAHRRVRKTYDFTSILGGPQATFSPESFDESGMDAYCVGEGEYAFRDFLIRVERGESFGDVENLITVDGVNPVRPLIEDLGELPRADRDLVLSNSFLRSTPKKTFYATRGCPFNCAYCCNSYYHELYRGKGKLFRRFPVDNVIEEIEGVQRKYRMDFVKFGDDCLTLRADDWLEEFAEKYRRRIGIPFNCFLRLDTITDDMLALLGGAGCYSVHLSVDSTSSHVRERVLNRRMQSGDLAGKLLQLQRHGINTWVNFMLAAPESILQDDLNTIDVSRRGGVTYTAYSTTVPMRKTALYDYCADRGLIDPETYVGDLSGCSERSRLTCFSEKEKDIRYNVFLLGAIIAKLPHLLYRVSLRLLRVIPPNGLFRLMRRLFYQYHISHTIFRLSGWRQPE